MNPEEMGEYAEGDILMPQLARNGVREESQRWPNGHIPYMIEGHFSESRKLVLVIFSVFTAYTNLKHLTLLGLLHGDVYLHLCFL